MFSFLIRAALFVIAATVPFSLALSAAKADITGTAIWLGSISEASRNNFATDGFAVLTPGCAVADMKCVTAAIDQSRTPGDTYVIAERDHTATVLNLLASEVKTGRVKGILMLRSYRAEIDALQQLSDAPKVKIIVEKGDPLAPTIYSRELVTDLQRRGVNASLWFIEPGMLQRGAALHPGLAITIEHFMGKPPESESLDLLLNAFERWPQVSFDNQDFLALDEFVTRKPFNQQVSKMLALHFQQEPHLLNQWRFQSYLSFDLLAYRDAVAPGARYASFRTRLGQYISIDLEKYAPYEPEIVVGMDDVENMYDFVWFYRTKLMYSWDTKVQNISARPLGPVIVFQKPVPPELAIPPRQRSALYVDGIEFSTDNPLAFIADYSANIQQVITVDNQCVYCHQMEGKGGSAHHIDAYTAEPQGGHALPLEQYTDEVLEPFIYTQEKVAAKVGLQPNPVKAEFADEVFAWIKGLRE